MNCSQAQKIPIRKVLESFSLFPSKENSKTAFYFALDREEKTPSLLVDFSKNTAFDFGTGKKFDNISIVQLVRRCSVSDALEYLSQFEFYKNNSIEIKPKDEHKYEILEKKSIEHPALIQYLNERKVIEQKEFLCEIHYIINSKKYFGIGFKNDSNGYEIRSKYSKICLGKKDVTHFKNGSEKLKIFEGFFDFLSFKSNEKSFGNSNTDFLILNSVFLIKNKFFLLENYRKIELFLDNDEAGSIITDEILEKFPNAEDCRCLYQNFKDLNDFVAT